MKRYDILFKTFGGGGTLGFTLAEVLITLGIIGVVAAMTIPTLMTKHQHKVNVIKWRKAYSQFSQAALMMSQDYNTSDFKEVLFANITQKDSGNVTTNAVIDLFSKYFKNVKANCNGNCNGRNGWNCSGILSDNYEKTGKTGYKYLNGTDAGYWVLGYYPTACFQTPDFVFGIDTNTTLYGRISIDVNGIKPPNVIGKDIFVLNMNNLSNVVPGGGENFYSGFDYECDENAKSGGPACSAKYLISY